MIMDVQLEREIKALSGDLAMTKIAVNNIQKEMNDLLNGDMGKDIHEVLNGQRVVKLGVIEKYKIKFRKLLEMIFNMF